MERLEKDDTDQPLDGKYLGTISSDFVKVCDILKEAAYQLKVRNISEHPIFAISRVQLQIGELLISKGEKDNQWFYYFSYKEQFQEMGLIDPSNDKEFLNAYKNPEEYASLFVVEPDFMSFIFVPYPEEEGDNVMV